MPRVRYAVQVLEQKGRQQSLRKWRTVGVYKNSTVAEVVLSSVRQDRINVAEVSRIWPVHTVRAVTVEA